MIMPSEIVETLGGPSRLAELMSKQSKMRVTQQMVFAWKKYERIPSWWLDDIQALMEKYSTRLSNEEIMHLISLRRLREERE